MVAPLLGDVPQPSRRRRSTWSTTTSAIAGVTAAAAAACASTCRPTARDAGAARCWRDAGVARRRAPLVALQLGASRAIRRGRRRRFVGARARRWRRARLRASCSAAAAAIVPLADGGRRGARTGRRSTRAAGPRSPSSARCSRGRDVLVTGDTGPMHMAVAVGTPVVGAVLRSGVCRSTPDRTAPTTSACTPSAPCAPCDHNVTCLDPFCRDALAPDAVAAAVVARGSRATGARSTPWRARWRRRARLPHRLRRRRPLRSRRRSAHRARRARTRSGAPTAPRGCTCSTAWRAGAGAAALDVGAVRGAGALGARRRIDRGRHAREARARHAAVARRPRAPRPRARGARSRPQGARRHAPRHQRADPDVHVRQGEPRRRRRHDARRSRPAALYRDLARDGGLHDGAARRRRHGRSRRTMHVFINEREIMAGAAPAPPSASSSRRARIHVDPSEILTDGRARRRRVTAPATRSSYARRAATGVAAPDDPHPDARSPSPPTSAATSPRRSTTSPLGRASSSTLLRATRTRAPPTASSRA